MAEQQRSGSEHTSRTAAARGGVWYRHGGMIVVLPAPPSRRGPQQELTGSGQSEVVQETGIIASTGNCSPAAVTGLSFADWKRRTGRTC